MTTKELIRAEIERRKGDALDKGFTFVPAALQGLLSFLDTLPDEPVTDCHDLEEEIERTYHDGSVADTDDMDHVDYENIARHFAEWQKRKMMEGAVEGVVNHGTVVSYVISDEDQLDERLKQFQNDAKVRIIIVKEEE